MPMNVLVTSGSPIRSRSVLTVLLLAGSIAAIAGGSANAGSQAVNGRIAYVSDAACRFDPNLKNDDIFSMAPDGSRKADLTRSVNPDAAPAWSADGTRLAFTRPGNANNDDVWVMSSNGKGQKNVTNTSPDDGNPDWSPDGSKITYDVSQTQVFEANQDGTGIRALVPGGYEAAWSPDGTRIAFVRFFGGAGEIFVMNADGSGQTDLTNSPANDGDPSWSPDGTKIAFTTDRGPVGDNEIYVMNADGTGQTDLTNTPANESDPDWQPVPGTPPAAPGPARMCKVPNLLGQKLTPARAKARKSGCVSGTVKYARSKKPRGRVVRQTPRKGLKLCFGVRVNVVVSRGLR